MSQSKILTVLVALLCSGVVATNAFAQYPGSSKELPGPPPAQKRIEQAYRECVKQIDSDLAELHLKDYQRQEHRKGEQTACDLSRRQCVEKPRSTDCRGFIEDYGNGSDDE